MTNPDGPDDFVMEFRGVQHREQADGTIRILMETSRGDIQGILNPTKQPTNKCVLFGHFTGPADGVYETLSPELNEQGIAALRIKFRNRELGEAVGDTLAGLSFLKAIGVEETALVGASFGGAVAIRAGTISPLVKGVATLASQTFGAQDVSELAPKHLLILHGLADQVLGPHNARNIYDWANEPKEMVLYPESDHNLAYCKDEVHDKLLEWLTNLLNGR
ncbi:MAG: alpha/beta hydrolase [SAR202 cluster bacterium]|nr:alpha/beta hydrolase [SAR202 cluster bacterium]|tara:strand:+ start:2083 stop:2742 length:660 start_codon:yes stop_codon:yes gene_type:complete